MPVCAASAANGSGQPGKTVTDGGQDVLRTQVEHLPTGCPDTGPLLVADEFLEQEQVDQVAESVGLRVGDDLRAGVEHLGDLVADRETRDRGLLFEPESGQVRYRLAGSR